MEISQQTHHLHPLPHPLPLHSGPLSTLSYRFLSLDVVSDLVRLTPEDSGVVHVDLLLAVHLPPSDVQWRVAVKLGRNYLVQLF